MKNDPIEGSNVAIVRGEVRGEVTMRTLAGGATVAQFDVATPTGDGPAMVPIAWHEPAERDLESVVDGAAVTVVGSVRKRFFRTGGTTRAVTELTVHRLVPERRRRTVTSLLNQVAEVLSG